MKNTFQIDKCIFDAKLNEDEFMTLFINFCRQNNINLQYTEIKQIETKDTSVKLYYKNCTQN